MSFFWANQAGPRRRLAEAARRPGGVRRVASIRYDEPFQVWIVDYAVAVSPTETERAQRRFRTLREAQRFIKQYASSLSPRPAGLGWFE